MSNESEIQALRARVAELEARLEYVYQHLRIEYAENPNDTDKEVLALLVRGNKIEAVKRYREIHNVGLAEAKQMVDGMEARLGL